MVVVVVYGVNGVVKGEDGSPRIRKRRFVRCGEVCLATAKCFNDCNLQGWGLVEDCVN